MSAGTPNPETPPGLVRLNAMDRAGAEAALRTCCGCARWAADVADARPFASEAALMAAAERTWAALDPAEWLEAFSHHPRIGERNLGQARFAKTAEQSAREQSGMNAADEGVRRALEEGNAEYEARFGHVFLICATGLSGAQMLERLRARLGNSPGEELRIAAGEQAKITGLRLKRMIA